MTTYSIIRFHRDNPSKSYVVKSDLSLEEAQEHCSDPSTSGEGWFDGYSMEHKPYRPKGPLQKTLAINSWEKRG